MKKIIVLLLTLIMVLSFASCGEKAEDGDKNNGINVDEGLLTVTITVPENLAKDDDGNPLTQEEIDKTVKEKGYISGKVNEDGTITYKFTKIKQKEMLKDFKVSIDESINDVLNGENATASFQKIEYNNDVTEFKVYMDPDLETAWDTIYTLGAFMQGEYYQMLDGVPYEKIDVKVTYINSKTNEEISSSTFKEWIEKISEDTTE